MKTKHGNRWYYKGTYEMLRNVNLQDMIDRYSMFVEPKHIQENDVVEFKLDKRKDIFSKK